MKKILIILLITILPFELCMAQNDGEDLYSIQDPLYFQLYGGVNKSANENLPFSEMTKYPMAWGAFFGFGKEVSSLWGWRVALRYNLNKSRNVQSCETSDVWGWKNVGLLGDATFDISDIFRLGTTESNSRFNLKFFAGIGAVYTWDFDSVPLSYTLPYSRSSRILPAARVGLDARWRIYGRWHLGMELSHNFFENHFNGVAAKSNIDQRTNMKIGITCLLYKMNKEPKQPATPIDRSNRLKKCPPLTLMEPDAEDVKARRLEGRAFLDFPVNETVIYPEYRNNANELRRIRASVDSALFDQSVTITRISLHGYASPESPYSNNTRLATGRTEALKNYLIGKYGFDKELFDNTFTPEDWGNLRDFLAVVDQRRSKGDYWYDNKEYVEMPEPPAVVNKYRDELIRVIDMDMDPDEKEILLKQVGRGEPYAWLYKYVYPGLRHTDYIIDYEVKPYSVKDGSKLIYSHPEALSMREMYLVAVQYEECSDRWIDALLIAAKYYPDNDIANYNAACACLMTKRLVDARRYLKRASSLAKSQYLNDIIDAMEGTVKWKIENGVLIIVD